MVRAAVVALVFLLAAPSALPQGAASGAIRGTVSDPAGARLPGARVVLIDETTAATQSAATDNEGRFAFPVVSPSDYTLHVTAPNMAPQSRRMHLDVGAAMELEFTLSLAGRKETVSVTAETPVVETQSPAVSTVIDERAIEELPLNGRRFSDLALLSPGVTQDPRSLTSSSNGDLAFGGVRGFQSSYFVDGVDNNNAFFAQARGRYRAPYQFSNEVVQEFRVSSNTYGAELGRSGGAVINVVTKSGTNYHHGTAFYFLRDSGWGARPAGLDLTPSSRQQQFGFTLGGPIRQNRVFYFAGYDQHIFHVPTLVRFLNGRTTVVPAPDDYEFNDKDLVFATAATLSQQAGNYESALLGNAAFLKLDFILTPRNSLNVRLNTSRYYGANNVFFDPASPITTYAISDNGEEDVATESLAGSLTTVVSNRVVNQLKAQFSRDRESTSANSSDVLTRIYTILDGMGRSTILPRETNEHRLHMVNTVSVDAGRHSLKFGGDFSLVWLYNFFPSMFGGEYIFSDIRVNPWTFRPQTYGLRITPLRAYAHEVPRYYIQNFGSAVSHPNTQEYAAFAQDTIRVNDHLALSLGVRYDLQTFRSDGLAANPLWPGSGKLPLDTNNIAPRVGFAWSIGDARPLVVRGGFGIFYTRIPQIYNSSIETDNGLAQSNLILDNTDFYDRQIFPKYPEPLVACGPAATSCELPSALAGKVTSDVSAFAQDFKTPYVEQASVSVERELAERLALGASYMYVRGNGLLRALDANLPEPEVLDYPVYDTTGEDLLGYYAVDSFAPWQMTKSLACPFPPCLGQLERPNPLLGAVNLYESSANSTYHGLTISLRRRTTRGLYFRVAYTFAHASDDGPDALITGRPANVQNAYAPRLEWGPSVTDQRHRFVASWMWEPRPFHREHELLGKIFNDWRLAGVLTLGSGRPFNARVSGDSNRDDNTYNDRLPGYSRNAFLGPDYATTDMRLARRIYISERIKLDFIVEAFNAFNRDNKRMYITDDSFLNMAAQFMPGDVKIGTHYYPATYRYNPSFRQATGAYAPRQIQVAVKLIF